MTGHSAAVRIEVSGVVQGVGFRPFVYRIAHEHQITGWVLNDNQGVSVHAEGDSALLTAFVSAVRTHAPPGAKIRSFNTWPDQVAGCRTFEIRSSQHVRRPNVIISPDLPVCGECLTELKDSTGRRYLYPYINCTACGPRYSIVTSLPYDRPNTTMAEWQLCDACRAEYEDPLNRRHHAQPTACHECGPGYQLVIEGEAIASGVEAMTRAVTLLCEGMILAVKGIGGYHLACDARDAAAVRRLRERKFRKEKPFALMTRNLETASDIARLSDLHCSLLADRARPILLAPSKVAFPGVAEDTDELGLMLPYAPLHELLFDSGAPNPLVMTSGNRSSEPIAFLDEDARQRLDDIADAFLIGERPIARRVEDSVVAVRDGRRSILRRARGLAPETIARLPSNRPILAVGSDLKNSLTLVVSGEAICGQHIGDLGDLETDRAFEQTIQDLLAMYEIDQRDLVVAHDAHPQFVSSRFAERLDCHRRVAVQHHRAHLASVMAEHEELDRPVVGIALDGTGYGDDAAIWGCELFTGSVKDGLQRVAHMRPAKLPGGDAAARYPVQAAAGFLAELDLPDLRQPPFLFPERFFQARVLVTKDVRCYTTTSAGRLFDTVAALCGFTREITFEGQAAMWLEHQARDVPPCAPYPFPNLDHRPLLASVITDRLAGRDVGEVSYAFHAGIAIALADYAANLAREISVAHVALSGGVMQNRLLRSLLNDQASDGRKLTLLFNQSVPANDGGISLGQAAMASV